MTKEEYLFFEWLILGKQMTGEELSNTTEEEREKLIKEYVMFLKSTSK